MPGFSFGPQRFVCCVDDPVRYGQAGAGELVDADKDQHFIVKARAGAISASGFDHRAGYAGLFHFVIADAMFIGDVMPSKAENGEKPEK